MCSSENLCLGAADWFVRNNTLSHWVVFQYQFSVPVKTSSHSDHRMVALSFSFQPPNVTKMMMFVVFLIITLKCVILISLI